MDKWLKNNLVVKILAVLLALMLWMVVNQERIFEKDPAIQVTSENISKEINRVPVTGYLPSEEFVILQMQQSVDLIIRGKRDLVNSITSTSYEVYVDLAGYGEGKHSVPIKTKGFPTGVEVEIRPALIEVTLEEKQVKEMPVTFEIVGNAREGYSIGTPSISPATVQVRAAKSVLGKAAIAKVFINIEDATTDIERPISLKVQAANGDEIQAEIEPPTVQITVPITPPSMTLSVRPTLIGEPPSGFAITNVTTNVNEVTLFGPKEVLNTLQYYPLPEIDVSKLTNTETFTFNLPEQGVPIEGIAKIIPAQVNVTITIATSEVLALSNIPVHVSGADAHDHVRFVNPVNGTLDITLEGESSIIKGVTAKDVKATIDVTGLPHGEHDVPIHWEIPKYTKLTKDIPNKAKVIIEKKSEETSTTPSDPNPTDQDEQPDESNEN